MNLRASGWAAGLVLAASVLVASPGHGAEVTVPQYTTAEEAGPDYLVQGEYVGRQGDERLGAQVVALGHGTFRAVFLPGGLPGDGWDGKTRIKVEGKTEGAETRFGGAGGWVATISDGKLAGHTDSGKTFELKRIVRESPDAGKKPPEGALVLFDGSSLDAFSDGKPAPDHLLAAGANTKKFFRDFTLHVEWKLPFVPEGKGEGRANSGVYIQKRYEIQILDSFGRDETPNECAGIYTRVPASINMTYPPLTWQTYDIDFQAAKWDAAGVKTKNAVVTVRHNGVVVQDHVEIAGKTGAGEKEAPNDRPIYFQLHGAPVVFRNIWIVEHP